MYHKKLGRVHWFLWHLDDCIKRDYRISYNYALHNYVLIRYRIVKPYDFFVIKRTSKRCFRCMYVCLLDDTVLYKSFSTSKECALWVRFVYDKSFPLISKKPP